MTCLFITRRYKRIANAAAMFSGCQIPDVNKATCLWDVRGKRCQIIAVVSWLAVVRGGFGLDPHMTLLRPVSVRVMRADCDRGPLSILL